jgi:hypothetical protein
MNGFGRSAVALCILAGVVCGGVGQEPAPDTQTLRVDGSLGGAGRDGDGLEGELCFGAG